MYESRGAVLDRAAARAGWRAWLAADAPAGYTTAAAPAAAGGAAGPVTLAELTARGLAVQDLAEAVTAAGLAADALTGVDLAAEADAALGAAAVALTALGHRIDGARLAVLGRFEARGGYRADGAVTAAAWYRTRTRLEPPAAGVAVRTAVRLRALPALAAALAAGRVPLRSVELITRRATPARMAAMQQHESALVDLAASATPEEVALAVQRICDQVDPDGSEPAGGLPEGPDDPRRSVQLHPTIDGLWDLAATLDPVTGELLATLLSALTRPDPPDTPPAAKRSLAQARHDALAELLRRAATLADLPQVHGRPPHVVLLIDLLILAQALGLLPEGMLDRHPDPRRRPAARLRSGLALSPAYALQLLLSATLSIVTSDGPWRPVNVGRRHRSLPPHLREVLDVLHTRCRGPDCQRDILWCDAHHIHPWTDGGDTDLNHSIPVCRAHHRLLDQGWTATLNTTTGTVTWTSPTATTHTNTP